MSNIKTETNEHFVFVLLASFIWLGLIFCKKYILALLIK